MAGKPKEKRGKRAKVLKEYNPDTFESDLAKALAKNLGKVKNRYRR